MAKLLRKQNLKTSLYKISTKSKLLRKTNYYRVKNNNKMYPNENKKNSQVVYERNEQY